MDHTNQPAYGLWSLVIINSLVFIIFAFSFAKPQSARDWRSFGAFSAFLVALFTEMYGFPLTIYLLSGWLSSKFPGVDFLTHDSGHLLEVMFGWRSNPHFGPFHLLSSVFIVGGFIVLASAWNELYKAQRQHRLAESGLYAHMRHPQYVGFITVMLGFLLQWPTSSRSSCSRSSSLCTCCSRAARNRTHWLNSATNIAATWPGRRLFCHEWVTCSGRRLGSYKRIVIQRI
jgi:protein-S-isoprenylcysteine O-methyltransferase Ste14